MSYTPEEKALLAIARKLRDNCRKFEESCDGCLFDTERGCVLSGWVDEWDLLSEEEEEY